MDGKRSGVILDTDTIPNAMIIMTTTITVRGFLTLYFDIDRNLPFFVILGA